MIHFEQIDIKTFLTDFWQKKPLVIRNALPGFINILPADELAGLSMDEDLESRIVIATPDRAPYWHLKKGPFLESDYEQLPPTHWTLLVQGVDRVIPELAFLFEHFNFIPQWRVDDLMISYASEHGSVGPHYDNYDVFLYQAQGCRRWSLTTQQCHEDNYLPDVPLRIMQQFDVEEEYILEEGDMLYLPPHVGHYGTAISKDCMTYSFGYRSYSSRELWDDFGDYCAETSSISAYYQDPNWAVLKETSELPCESWMNAKAAMHTMLDNEQALKSWFGAFVTQLDQHAESLLPEPRSASLATFIKKLSSTTLLTRHPVVRFAYLVQTEAPLVVLFINGRQWDTQHVSPELIKLVANNRALPIEQLRPWLTQIDNQQFLFKLWRLQWLTHR
jgi:50S ribosomal protein L16 3-hydroxylase